MSDIEATIPVADTLTASKNEPILLPLYTLDGGVIYVAPGDVDRWLALGFQRSLFDPVSAAAALKALFPAAQAAIETYVAGVIDDGVIDPADDAAAATAQTAMRELGQAWGDLQRGIALRYSMRQAPSVRMRDARGRDADVDPSQVPEFTANGWSIVQ